MGDLVCLQALFSLCRWRPVLSPYLCLLLKCELVCLSFRWWSPAFSRSPAFSDLPLEEPGISLLRHPEYFLPPLSGLSCGAIFGHFLFFWSIKYSGLPLFKLEAAAPIWERPFRVSRDVAASAKYIPRERGRSSIFIKRNTTIFVFNLDHFSSQLFSFFRHFVPAQQNLLKRAFSRTCWHRV